MLKDHILSIQTIQETNNNINISHMPFCETFLVNRDLEVLQILSLYRSSSEVNLTQYLAGN